MRGASIVQVVRGRAGVEVKDPPQPHMNLLRTYTDADIHICDRRIW